MELVSRLSDCDWESGALAACSALAAGHRRSAPGTGFPSSWARCRPQPRPGARGHGRRRGPRTGEVRGPGEKLVLIVVIVASHSASPLSGFQVPDPVAGKWLEREESLKNPGSRQGWWTVSCSSWRRTQGLWEWGGLTWETCPRRAQVASWWPALPGQGPGCSSWWGRR